jgi:hypothetical protein
MKLRRVNQFVSLHDTDVGWQKVLILESCWGTWVLYRGRVQAP